MTTLGPTRRNTGFKVLLSMACFVVVIGGLRAASEFITPILLGLFLAVLSFPITGWLKEHRIPHGLAVFMTIVVDILVLTGLIFGAIGMMPDFQASAVKYDQELRQMVLTNVDQLEKFATNTFGPVQTWFAETFGEEGKPMPPKQPPFDIRGTVESLLSVNSLISLVNLLNKVDVIQKIGSFLTLTFFAVILMIFILAEAGRYVEKFETIALNKGPNFLKFRNTGRDVQRYLAIKTLVSIPVGVLAWITCALFGVEFAVLWGLAAFFFNFVPTIGAFVAAFPPIIIGMLQLGNWQALGILACYTAINIGIGNFIEPMLLGRRFGISTVVVILSVLFWGWVWGPVGMFLAVPLTMVIKMMLENSDDFRWISVAMGKDSEEGIDAFLEESIEQERETAAVLPPTPAEEPLV